MNLPQTIVHAKAGSVVPRAYFETALRKCPTVSGFCVRYEEDGQKSLQTDRYDRIVTVDNMVELDESGKDFERAYYMANITLKKVDKEDVQPFTITIFDADNPEDLTKAVDLVSFFVEGDFPKFSDDKTGHTDEYNFAQGIIIPALQEIYEDVDGDVGKFTAKLHKPTFQNNLLAHVGHRAAFLFFPLEGDAISFGDSKGLAGEYGWGSVSNHLDWEKKQEAPITKAAGAVADAVASVKKNIFGIKGAAPKPTGDASAIKTDDKGIHHTPPKEEVAPKAETAVLKGKVVVSPPKSLIGGARNKWIRLFNNNNLPDKHYQPDLKLYVDPDIAPFAQRQDLKTEQDVKNLALEMSTGNKPKEAVKDMAGPQKKVEVKKPEVKDFIPDMTDQELVDVTGILASFVDRDKVPSAADIQKMEKPWPLFSEKVGIPFTDMFRWRTEELSKIFKDKYALMAFVQMRRIALEGGMKLSDLTGGEKPKVIVPDVPLNKKDDITPAAKKTNVFGLKKTG